MASLPTSQPPLITAAPYLTLGHQSPLRNMRNILSRVEIATANISTGGKCESCYSVDTEASVNMCRIIKADNRTRVSGYCAVKYNSDTQTQHTMGRCCWRVPSARSRPAAAQCKTFNLQRCAEICTLQHCSTAALSRPRPPPCPLSR